MRLIGELKDIVKDSKGFAYYIYWIFIIGINLHQLFAGNLLLQRMSILFTWVSFPAIAFIGSYLWKSRKNIFNLILFIVLSSIVTDLNSQLFSFLPHPLKPIIRQIVHITNNIFFILFSEYFYSGSNVR